MLLEQVVRRNRRRIVALAAMATLNAWLMSSLAAGLAVAFYQVVFIAPRTGIALSSDVVVIGSMASGGAGTLLLLGGSLRSAAHTPRRLRAVPLREGELPRVQSLMAQLAIAIGAPRVAVALLDDEAPNALAVGLRPRKATIVVTTGLVEKLTRDELEAVLATQLCAVRRLDTALQTWTVAATTFTGSVHRHFRVGLKLGQPWYSRLDWSAWIIALVTWPTWIYGRTIRRIVLRSFDFGVDEMAVQTTRHPEALVSALRKLRDDGSVVAGLTAQTAPLWFEPIPHDKDTHYEFGRHAFAPSLRKRLARLTTRHGVT